MLETLDVQVVGVGLSLDAREDSSGLLEDDSGAQLSQ